MCTASFLAAVYPWMVSAGLLASRVSFYRYVCCHDYSEGFFSKHSLKRIVLESYSFLANTPRLMIRLPSPTGLRH
jgi:hypothetical protein